MAGVIQTFSVVTDDGTIVATRTTREEAEAHLLRLSATRPMEEPEPVEAPVRESNLLGPNENRFRVSRKPPRPKASRNRKRRFFGYD